MNLDQKIPNIDVEYKIQMVWYINVTILKTKQSFTRIYSSVRSSLVQKYIKTHLHLVVRS